MFGRNRPHQTYRRVMFVDPGISGSGMAYWDSMRSHPKTPCPPDDYAQWLPGTDEPTWVDKFEACCVWFWDMVCALQPRLVVIEFPRLWGTSKSQAAARSGNLFKLAALVGGMMEITLGQDIALELPYPGTWKGQLPKDIMKDRVKELLGQRYPNHTADAVAMGLAAQGKL